jgi:hypothetical protein
MIAMQYSFSLPADYDMGIIDRRIRDKGPALDGFPGLAFKVYLSARKGEFGSRENLYAPFYLWNEPEGAVKFISGPGFAALTEAFGRPRIRQWLPWHVSVSGKIDTARFAHRELQPIGHDISLSDLRQEEAARLRQEADRYVSVARIVAFDPSDWTMIRFGLDARSPSAGRGQIYRVGHVSQGTIAECRL